MTQSTAPIVHAARQILGADSSQFFLKVGDLSGDSFLVESVKLQHWRFHQDFTLKLKVLALKDIDDTTLLHAATTFQLQTGGSLKPLHGLITEWTDADGNGDYRGLQLTISSVLNPLRHQQHNRVFVDRSATDIAEELLQNSLGDLAGVDVLCQTSPVLPMTVQYHESDYDFIRRILAKEGVFLNLHQDDTRTIVQLSDDLTQLPEHEITINQRFATNAGAAKDDTHVSAVIQNQQHHLSQVVLNDYQPWVSASLMTDASLGTAQGIGTSEHWGLNYDSSDSGRQLATRMAQVHDWQRQTLTIRTTSREFSPGMLLQLTDHPRFSGDYRVIDVEYSGSQRAASGGSNDKGWSCDLIVLPADLPWCPPYAPRQPHYAAMSAVITEEIDDNGCYRVRLPFDRRANSEGPASPPIRLMQPLGGSDHGMHFPLAKGTEVSVLWENGDLDRPYIQGALYNGQAENPVTDANARQNLIRTRGDHRLLFDDTPDQEHIHLTTPEDQNHLTLSAASEGHFAELVSEQGEVRLRAGKSATFESGEDQQVTVGANHSIHVQQDYSLQTEEGQITVAASTDMEWTAGKAIRMHNREQNIELRATKAMQFQAGNNFWQQVDSGNCDILVSDGSYSLETGADQVFNSQGNSITITQGDATVQLDGSGNLTLQANSIELTADSIAIKGGSIGDN
ncbi:type VI secretion system Vgr family protein [Gynuella sunshinyii]|uniref:Gp5/Type VI secretion system Vgr protein OB-fold domain-containing protein n=1 Tax=Gynuella sunshinyii YC6258 TaxID=1445510 RepID=A0A0C5VF75_9GAMM|nr:type VI secretion system Vgr family protein [Gynuella sunshinyii]AJQ97920.1 hypothetical protein YC6258_05892 [Gynuella sunshinyii YC6258]